MPVLDSCSNLHSVHMQLLGIVAELFLAFHCVVLWLVKLHKWRLELLSCGQGAAIADLPSCPKLHMCCIGMYDRGS